MTFKWPGIPADSSPSSEIADFAELVCIRDGAVSATAVQKAVSRLAENEYEDGVPEIDPEETVVESAFNEIENRFEAANGGYPFDIGELGNHISITGDSCDPRHFIYRFLLLATRLDMRRERMQSGLDGTKLFERLCAQVAKAYFGDRAEAMVFGTATTRGNIKDRVNDLCNRINEGGGFFNRDDATPNAKDGKLDVVVWKPFKDDCHGKILGFGQCKTGTAYHRLLSELQPDTFCSKWMRDAPAVNPVRMFFVSEALQRTSWYSTVREAGLLLDRCRIVDYCENVSIDLMRDIEKWCAGAAGYAELAA
jgi:hypothetical protein